MEAITQFQVPQRQPSSIISRQGKIKRLRAGGGQVVDGGANGQFPDVAAGKEIGLTT